jgi:hypothetical protein
MLRHRLRPLPLADLFYEGFEARGQRRVGLAVETYIQDRHVAAVGA